jgi:hypothetical protein
MTQTPTNVLDRYIALWKLLLDSDNAFADYSEDNQPFEVAEMPAVVVRVGPVIETVRQGRAHFLMTREYRHLLHVARTEEDIANPDTSALRAVEPYLLSVPLFFLDRPRLELSGTGLVVSSTLPADDGIPRIVREGAVYRGAVFTSQVTTRH